LRTLTEYLAILEN